MTDEYFMQRCLQLAQNGAGNAAPNPMVGSVIVLDDKIIGEGYHQKCGEAHAEVNAVNSVMDKSQLTEATIYVNLEPCAHFGRTPPCADLIVKHQFKRVVVGCVDSFSEVSGKGIERMRNAGIEVAVGVLEKECLHLNRRFFTFHSQKRPYIILKWAQTQDGFIDISEEEKLTSRGVWITNEQSKQMVHKWRMEEAAIMAGTDTVITDNPSLTVRNWTGNNPVRVIPDRQLRIPRDKAIFDGSAPTLLYTTKDAPEEGKGFEFITIGTENFFQNILTDLYNRGLTSLFIEGGASLLNFVIGASLWDEARVFTGNNWFGAGVVAPKLEYKPIKTEKIGDVQLRTFTRQK